MVDGRLQSLANTVSGVGLHDTLYIIWLQFESYNICYLVFSLYYMTIQSLSQRNLPKYNPTPCILNLKPCTPEA